jgi:hypothetical protein
MDASKLTKGELIAAIGGLILALAVFLPAYTPSSNPNAIVAGGRVDASIWDAQHKMRILLLLAAVAPVILIYIILRDNELSWPKGEVTAVLGLVALTLVFYSGILDRPGDPDGQIGLGIGWYLAFVGALTIAAGGAVRASTVERRRKPPGVL